MDGPLPTSQWGRSLTDGAMFILVMLHHNLLVGEKNDRWGVVS